MKAADVIAQSVAKGDLPSKTFSSALRTAVDTTKFIDGKKPLLKTKMASFLNDLKLEKIVSAVPAPQRELNFNEWLDEFDALPENVNLSDVPLNVGKVGSVTLKERNLQEFVDKLDNLPPEKQDDFFAKHQDSFLNDVLTPVHQRYVDGIRA